MHTILHKPWIKAILQNRLALYAILMVIELQFFSINMLNTTLREPTDGWELKIDVIDNNLTPNGYWLLPYFMGLAFASLIPLWGMLTMPNRIYREFVLALALALTFSYVVYILVPTYVVKPAPDAVPGDDWFARLLRRTYEADAAASSHNAAPSQHVFYALLNMCFMIRFRPTQRTFWIWTGLGTLITVSTLTTMRHNSPDLITGFMVAVVMYYAGVYLGGRLTDALADDDDPIRLPGWLGRAYDWWMIRREAAKCRQRVGTAT